MNLNILYEDNHILVCVKPAGIPSQSARIGTPDIVSMLKNHIAQTNKDGKKPYLSIIHRLDQPVEGILVFAKTPFAAKELNRQLTMKGFGKYYIALLCGTPGCREKTLTDYLIKDAKTNTSRIGKENDADAKKAELSYRIIEDIVPPIPNTSVAEIRLHTGRHHQIRVQMAGISCPLYGDVKYNPMAGPGEHPALCAYRFTFHHPKTKELLSFEITPHNFPFPVILNEE